MVISPRDLEEFGYEDAGLLGRLQSGFDKILLDYEESYDGFNPTPSAKYSKEEKIKIDEESVRITPAIAARLVEYYTCAGWNVKVERNQKYESRKGGGYSFTFSKE